MYPLSRFWYQLWERCWPKWARRIKTLEFMTDVQYNRARFKVIGLFTVFAWLCPGRSTCISRWMQHTRSLSQRREEVELHSSASRELWVRRPVFAGEARCWLSLSVPGPRHRWFWATATIVLSACGLSPSSLKAPQDHLHFISTSALSPSHIDCIKLQPIKGFKKNAIHLLISCVYTAMGKMSCQWWSI